MHAPFNAALGCRDLAHGLQDFSAGIGVFIDAEARALPLDAVRFIFIFASRLENFICFGERRQYAWRFRADEIVVRAVPQTRDSDGWMNPIRDRHDVLPFDLALTDFARSVRAPAIT